MNALMANILSRGRNETHADQWEAQILIRILQKARVIMVSQAPDQLIRDMHMIPAHSMEEALAMAERMVGQENAPITVIPDGVGVVVLPEVK
jgi:nickel-dependent lactate racemase